jgi:uroporphyrin-III C-methyltransferase/precorrin-2 dehydrogenase/sirohydrochlorin ferrochelatase
MQVFPLFIKLKDRPVLLVGGGDAAAAKLRLLAAAGATCTVVAPDFSADLLKAASDAQAILQNREFQADDVDGQQLVFSAHEDEAMDRRVVAAAKARNVLVNVVDRPEMTDLVMPAVVDRDDVVVAISTNGAAPVLARKIRAAIESVLPHRIGRLAAFARHFRSAVHDRLGDAVARRRFWEDFFEGPVASAVLAGDERRAAREVIRAINRRQGPMEGELATIVTAGDPELLTLRDLRLLRQADIVIHDAAMPQAIIDFTRRDARRIALAAEQSDTFMQDEAKAGHRIVRLKLVVAAKPADLRAVAE